MSLAAMGREFSEVTRDRLKNSRKDKTPARNYFDWPHPEGKKCKCRDCYVKKFNYQKSYKNAKKLAN